MSFDVINFALGGSSGGEGDSLWESGSGSHSIILKNIDAEAEGDYAIAMGSGTSAEGNYSVAEGLATNANGLVSHAEGQQTMALGDCSHAEGGGTTADGDYSHVEGNNTTTNNPYEHAEGHFNMSNINSETYGDSGNTIHSIGIGNSLMNRKNAIEIMQNGDVYIIGIGDYDGTNYSDAFTLEEILENTPTRNEMNNAINTAIGGAINELY